MQRAAVDSETIASVGYDPTWKMLEIEFRQSGEVYLHFEVPQSEYEAVMSAPSKGTYLNQQFKKAGYRFERVDKTK